MFNPDMWDASVKAVTHLASAQTVPLPACERSLIQCALYELLNDGAIEIGPNLVPA
jgi:hypothetical protein